MAGTSWSRTNPWPRREVLALCLAVPMLGAGAARATTAAPVRILSAGAVEAALRAAATAFTARTGQDVSLTFTSAANVQKRLMAGEAPDLAVGPAAVIDALERAGRIDAAGRAPLGVAQLPAATAQSPVVYVMAPAKAAPVTAGAKAFAAYLKGDGQAVLTANGLMPAAGP
jgi:ABC-type molybdate transport system substrate-binding protein